MLLLTFDIRIVESTVESMSDESPTVISDSADQEPTGYMPFFATIAFL